MRRRKPSWMQPHAAQMPAAPFNADEDAELTNMVTCGLACEYYRIGLPHRPFGQILERRLQLIQAGALQRATAI